MSLTGDWSANLMMNAILGAKDHGASKQEALQHGKDVLNQIMQASSRTPEGEAPMVDETDWRDTLVSTSPYAAWGFYIYQNAQLQAEFDRFVPDDVPTRVSIQDFYKKNLERRDYHRFLKDIQNKIMREFGSAVVVWDFRTNEPVSTAEQQSRFA